MRTMKRVFLLKLSALFICLFCSISSAAQSDIFVQYRLAGKQVFSNDSVRTWSVVQELIDEETGISTLNENFARVTGVKAEFDFSKVDAKETIYHVTAKGEGMDQRYEVHVFDPDKISSVWYKSGSNPPVRTFIFVPRSVSTKTKFIVVMHGMTRTALKYIESWEQ